MAINITCSGCNTRFKVSEKYAGKKGPCPKCKNQIEIPRQEEQIVVQAPEEVKGPQISTGQPVLKPMERHATKHNALLITVVAGGILLCLVLALCVRFYAKGDISYLVKAMGAILVAPLFSWVGYGFLRDSELEPYHGISLWLRLGICSVIYPLLWAGFAMARPIFFDNNPLDSWNLLILAFPFLCLGTLTSFASLDLNSTNAFLHYAFYLLVTIALRLLVELPPY